MASSLLDTNIIINYLRKDKKTVSFLEQHKIPKISVITVAELYQGAKDKKELKNLKKLLSYFKILPLDKNSSSLAIKLLEKYYLSHSLIILDALIAATAIENNLTLITANIKHFKMIKKLKLKNSKTVIK